MSAKQSALWAPAPSTSRGQATKLDGRGDKLVYTSGRGVFIRDLRNPAACVAYLEHVKDATVARLSPSGAYCASADVTGAVRVWDVLGTDQILKSETKVIAGRITDLAWGESTRIIAVGDGKQSFGHAFSPFSYQSRACLTPAVMDTSSSCGSIEGHSKVANAVAIRQQRPFRAATGGDDGTIVFYTGVPFKFSKVIKTHSSFVQVRLLGSRTAATLLHESAALYCMTTTLSSRSRCPGRRAEPTSPALAPTAKCSSTTANPAISSTSSLTARRRTRAASSRAPSAQTAALSRPARPTRPSSCGTSSASALSLLS